MIYSIFSAKDATLYEQYPSLNTGLDAVLEINKASAVSGSTNVYYNSRIAVKFDLTNFTNNFDSTLLTQTASYYLRLTATEPSEIPTSYTLLAHPISQSWNMGTGRYTIAVTSSDGASWNYRLTSANTASAWLTASFANGTTGSWATNPGGSTWFTASAHSQSFDYQTTDVLMDVTAAVRQWIAGARINEGFVIKKSDTDERSLDVFNSLRFFSKDTHTVYGPRLEMRYDDSLYLTSSTLVDYNEEVVVNLSNIQPQYAEDSKARINISARPKYPDRTFATMSYYYDTYRLPSSSFYSVRDAHTSDVIIPFDETNTKISADGNGSYFILNFNGLAPERYYRLLIKSKTSSTEEYVYDKNWIFKVVR